MSDVTPEQERAFEKAWDSSPQSAITGARPVKNIARHCYQAAIQHERERIVKALEEKEIHAGSVDAGCDVVMVSAAIDIVKGGETS